MSNQNSSTNTKNIEVGKFYLIFDGSRTGHPGFVIWKDDEKMDIWSLLQKAISLEINQREKRIKGI